MNFNSSIKLARKATFNNSSQSNLKKPLNPVDMRCEFEVPKFIDLNALDDFEDDRFSTLVR